MENRIYYEKILKEEFIKKGGNVQRNAPHYMTVEHSPGLENGAYIKIPIEEFDLSTVSFTYGAMKP